MLYRLILLLFLSLPFLQIKAQQNFVIIKGIEIEGNRKTRDAIILRELAIGVGDTLKTNQVDSLLEIDRRKISNTNLFNGVKLSLRYTNVQQANLLIAVEERWYFVALPVFYLGDRNFNEWWYDRNHDFKRTVYGIYISHKNLTGNADRLRLRAEAGFIPKLELTYSTPYLDKKQKTGILLGALYAINRSIPYRTWQDKLEYLEGDFRQRKRTSFYAELTRREGFYQFHELELSYNKTDIADSVAIRNPNYFLNGDIKQQYLFANYAYRYDRRDDVGYPLRGKKVLFEASQYGILKTDNVRQTNFLASWTQYLSLGKKFYYQYSLRGKASFPKKQAYAQTVGLGYRNDYLRGYELYVIDGQDYSLLKTSLKRELVKRQFSLPFMPEQFRKIPATFYLNFFADVGYVRNYQATWGNSQLSNRALLGYGIGLDCATWYNAVFRINYSRNNIGDGRFFFNLAREF